MVPGPPPRARANLSLSHTTHTVDRIREEIDQLMTEKLKLLTAPMVKKLLEEVIRTHLGWLIVWGNVFGGIIGLISQAAGFGMN